MVGKSGKRTRSPFRRSWRRENVGKRQFAVRCHVQVWRFDVENDDDVRDAVVVDDGGGGERADAAAGDGGTEVDDGDRVVWDSRRRGITPAAAGGIAEKGSDSPRRRCALKIS